MFDEKTAEMLRLYQKEKLSLREISERLGITARAVHYRLSRTGIIFRSKSRPSRIIEREVLVQLYVDRGLPIYKVAKKLKAAQETVVKELCRHKIEQRPRRKKTRRYPELDGLQGRPVS